MIKKSSTEHQNTPASTSLQLYLLGSPQIELTGETIRLPYQKAEALLYYLATTSQPHSRTGLATLLWGNTREKQARNSLRNALYTLRRHINAPDFLHTERRKIALNQGNVRLDAVDFQRSIQTADTIDSLGQGLSLWRGPFLDGLTLPDSPEFENWLGDQRTQFQGQYIQGLLKLSRLYQVVHRLDEARTPLEKLLTLDALHEIAHQYMMRLHLQQGNRAAALRQYELLRERLRDELGVNPSQATRALHLEILRADDSTPAPAFTVAVKRNDFVGRRQELVQLNQLYHKVTPRGPAQLIMLNGEAGIGKTRLAQEWLATRAGPLILMARAFQTEQAIPFQPWIDLMRGALAEGYFEQLELSEVWLVELAHLVPDIRQQYPDLTPAAATDPDLARGRIMQAVYHWLNQLCAQRPVCIFIDDWQWLDQASLTLARYILLSPESIHLPLLMVGTRHDSAAQPSWLQLKSELSREGRLHQLDLSRLQPGEAAALARTMNLSAQLQTGPFFKRLFDETEGNPLFIVEFLRSLPPEAMTADTNWPVPVSVQSVIRDRLDRLTANTSRVLSTAAVLGRAFSEVELQRIATDLSASVVLQGIDEAIAAKILTEQGRTYDFTHDKIRTVLLDGLTRSRRRWLHQQVVQAFEATHSADFSRLSYHAEMSDDLQRAHTYALRAARQAVELYADEEAVRWYEKAKALLTDAPAELPPAAIPKVTPFKQRYVSNDQPLDVYGLILRQHGLIIQRTGSYEKAAATFEAAVQRGKDRGRPDEQAAAHNLLSFLGYLRSDYDAVGRHAELALELTAELDDPAVRAPGLRHLGIAVYRTGNYEEARHLYDEALAAYQQAGDQVGAAGVYNNIGFVLRTLGRYDEAITAFEQARALYEEMGLVEGMALIYANLGRTYAFSGNLQQAQNQLTYGLGLSVEAHTDWITVKIHRTLGSVHAQRMQWSQALRHAKLARSLSKSLGSDEDLGAALRLLAKIAAAWPQGNLGDPTIYFEQSIELLQKVGAQDELELVQTAYAAYRTTA